MEEENKPCDGYAESENILVYKIDGSFILGCSLCNFFVVDVTEPSDTYFKYLHAKPIPKEHQYNPKNKFAQLIK